MVNDLSECICYKCDLGRPVSGRVVHCGKDKKIDALKLTIKAMGISADNQAKESSAKDKRIAELEGLLRQCFEDMDALRFYPEYFNNIAAILAKKA